MANPIRPATIPPVPGKAGLRARFIALRRDMRPDARSERSARIVERLSRLVGLRSARVVLAYWPMDLEVDVAPLVLRLAADGVVIGLPVVPARGAGRELTFRRFAGVEHLEAGPFGTSHPLGDVPVDPADADLVIVPALAADRSGWRLGWGSGYYDRLIGRHAPETACPIFADCLVDSLPHDGHDRQVRTVVTELETIAPDDLP